MVLRRRQEEQYGYRHNNAFDAVQEEYRAVRDRVGVIDLTGFAKYDVCGRDAGGYLNRILANRESRDGGITWHTFSRRTAASWGKQQSPESATSTFTCSPPPVPSCGILTTCNSRSAPTSRSLSKTSLMSGGSSSLPVHGQEVLTTLTDSPLDNSAFRWHCGQDITVADIPTQALRINYVGELGWELHPAMADLHSYDAVWRAGEAHGIADFGLYALNSLRMEKAYRGWGSELTNEVNLMDADMARFFGRARRTLSARRRRRRPQGPCAWSTLRSPLAIRTCAARNRFLSVTSA